VSNYIKQLLARGGRGRGKGRKREPGPCGNRKLVQMQAPAPIPLAFLGECALSAPGSCRIRGREAARLSSASNGRSLCVGGVLGLLSGGACPWAWHVECSSAASRCRESKQGSQVASRGRGPGSPSAKGTLGWLDEGAAGTWRCPQGRPCCELSVGLWGSRCRASPPSLVGLVVSTSGGELAFSGERC
jgi:hypothetical protein